MKTVSLRYYDAVNLGDDLFVKIVLERYRNSFIISSRSRYIVQRYDNARASVVSDLLNRAMRYVRRGRAVVAPARFFTGDLLLYIGGSLFIEQGNPTLWSQERQLYRRLSHPYYILGSNIGPYRSPEFLEMVRSIFRGAADVCVRDSYSYDLAKDIPQVRHATDIVLTLDVAPYPTSDNGSYVISVIDVTQKFDATVATKYDTMIVALTTRLLANDNTTTVTLMSFCKKEGDEAACERILAQLPTTLQQRVSIHRYRGDIDGALQTLAQARAIIGSRFHANIVGMVFGKKILPIAYSDKTINILADMQYTGPVVDIRTIDDFDPTTINFDAIAVQDISHLKPLAEEQFQVLDTVLERRD